jgi:hypothetical protein
MWSLLALAVLAPIVWALAGAPATPELVERLSRALPVDVTAASVSTSALVVALLLGALLGIGRAQVATTHVSTVAHELGHGLAAAALGGRIDRLRMHRDGSGVAEATLPGRRPVSRFVISAVGYVAPGVLALASIRAALAGAAVLWVAYLVAVLAIMLVLAIRSWWGTLLVVVLGALGWALITLAPAPVAVLAVAALAGVLAGGGLVDALVQWRGRARGRSDASSMARQTGLPVGLFAGLHMLLAASLAVVTVALPLWP